MKKKILYLVGKTIDGKLLIGGTLIFKETFGLPMDIILDVLHENNMVTIEESTERT